MNNEERLELYALLDTQPLSVTEGLLERIEGGFIDGRVIVISDCERDHPNCGCIYGTVAILNGANGSEDALDFYRRISHPFADLLDEMTDLEKFAYHIQLNDTPKNNIISEKLRDAVVEYLNTRKEE